VAFLAIAFLAALFGKEPAARALIEDDGPHKADAIVVLGGDEYCTRVLQAAQLASRGLSPVILVSGPRIFDGHESDYTIGCATRAGFPASLFHALPSDVDSTKSEGRQIGEYLKSEGVKSIMLVTSNYHTRRAARLFRRSNPGLVVYAEPAPDPDFTPETWWHTRNGQRTFLLEWTKTLAAALGY
jgi:uncharacterized SAM-binding protein YcdF (DUF218 family)